MQLVFVAARTVLLPLHALRMEPLVLHAEVVPVFALAARENDFFSGHVLVLGTRFSGLGVGTRVFPEALVPSTESLLFKS
jgi:hypothetical protein